MAQRLRTSKQIHDEYSWDTIVREQWAPFIAKLAEVAPPLDSRFVSTPATVDTTQVQPDVKEKPAKRRGKIVAVNTNGQHDTVEQVPA